jgi:hypothetical protein
VHPSLEPIRDLSDLCAYVGGGRPASRAARTNAAARASAFGKLPRLAWASVSVAGGAGGAGEHVRQASAAARMSARGPDLRRNCWFLPTAKSSFLRASIQSETSALFGWLSASQQRFSLTLIQSPVISQPTVFFSHNESASATGHQPAERGHRIVSPEGNGFLNFSALSSLIKLPCQYFA